MKTKCNLLNPLDLPLWSAPLVFLLGVFPFLAYAKDDSAFGSSFAMELFCMVVFGLMVLMSLGATVHGFICSGNKMK